MAPFSASVLLLFTALFVHQKFLRSFGRRQGRKVHKWATGESLNPGRGFSERLRSVTFNIPQMGARGDWI